MSLPRDVPLNDGARYTFQIILTDKKEEDRLFFGWHGRTHDQAMKSIQNWIANHRHLFRVAQVSAEPDYQQGLNIKDIRPRLTFHGLRHAYARQEYNKRIQIGLSIHQARLEVAALLGHGRDEVTKIYLAQT